MEKNLEKAIKKLLDKSEEALKDAKTSLDNNRIDNASNRIYYALFYSVSALAMMDNFKTSKHSQLIGWFNKKYIHENKIFSIELLQTLKESFEIRQISDYSIVINTNKNDLLLLYEQGEQFIKTIKNYIELKLNE